MDATARYEPPCRAALSAKVACEACRKRVTLHTLKYRHVCEPMVERMRRATDEAHVAVRARAEAALETERAAKYAHLLNL
eukprot:9915687-Alexandrium_andersonii.AAC.1